MKIELVAKNCIVNQKITQVIEKKIAKFDKYFEDDATCRIYLKKENLRTCKMEVELGFKAFVLRAQASADNPYDAIDLVIPKLEKQIYKHRSKFEKQLKQNALKDEMFTPEDLAPTKIVKSKKFKLQPMDIAEATDEFELLGHDFYVFFDKDDNKVKVLYRRDDGNLGLIDPEI